MLFQLMRHHLHGPPLEIQPSVSPEGREFLRLAGKKNPSEEGFCVAWVVGSWIRAYQLPVPGQALGAMEAARLDVHAHAPVAIV